MHYSRTHHLEYDLPFLSRDTKSSFFSHFFFFNDTATTEIYTLSLHDALPIYHVELGVLYWEQKRYADAERLFDEMTRDRKSTRLNSSHANISYAVFCLKKKKADNEITT